MAAESPTPAEIRAAREAAGLSCPQAARLIHATPRAWQLWEAGERRMHPAFFELFRGKVGSIQLNSGELDLARQWYNAVQDMAPQYLAGPDHALGEKIRRACGR